MTCVRNHHLVVFFLWYFCFLSLLFLPRCSSMCSYFIVHRFSCRYASFRLKKRSELVLWLVISFQKGIPFQLLLIFHTLIYKQLKIYVVYKWSTSENVECFCHYYFLFYVIPIFLNNKFYSFIWAFSFPIFSSKW